MKILYKEEEFDVEEAIEDFINVEWSKDDESRGKALNILKGLIYSDDDKAKKFIKDLDKASNSLNVEDYELKESRDDRYFYETKRKEIQEYLGNKYTVSLETLGSWVFYVEPILSKGEANKVKQKIKKLNNNDFTYEDFTYEEDYLQFYGY